MNNRAVTLSIIMALLAVFFVKSYVDSVDEAVKEKFGDRVIVLKATKDIAEQHTINDTDFAPEEIPEDYKEPTAIHFAKGMTAEERNLMVKQIVGSIALVPIRKGEQLSNNMIAEPGIRTGLAPQITPGKRAIAIPVSEISGVAKLVKPGDRVDLIAVLDSGRGKEFKIAKTILQDVVILSVGKYVNNNAARLIESDPFSGKPTIKQLASDGNFSSVTLEVEPAQAQMLALVMNNGENAITLSLRNNDDTGRENVDSTMVAVVLGPDINKVNRQTAGNRR